MLTVSPEQFAAQLDWLARKDYSPIHTSDWVAWLKQSRPLPNRPVLITFDDGYEDITQYALPVLFNFGFKAVVYIVSGLMGKTNEWDKQLGWGELRLMSERQIMEWAQKGVEIGSHTRRHFNLTTLSQSELEDQVCGSAKDLQETVGLTPVSFAYPFGNCNQAVRDCAAKIYQTSVSVVEAICSASDDRYLMPRIWVRPNENVSKFAQRVKFACTPTLRQRVGILLRSYRAGRLALTAKQRAFNRMQGYNMRHFD